MKDPIEQQNFNDIDVVKMVREFYRQKYGEYPPLNSEYDGMNFSADFAQFYLREKMRKVIEKMKVKKVDYYKVSGDFCINERDGYHLAICDLSDLTKTEES